VGVGALGIHHTRVAAAAPGARLVGVYEHHPERARRAVPFGAHLFDSLEALLDEVEAVVVSTPTKSHHAVGKAALERGISCLIEKPLAATVDEAQDLVQAALRAGATLCVGHTERVSPVVRAVADQIRRPRFIEAHRLGTFGPRGLDVDVLLDLMIHDVDLVLSWTGAAPIRVQGAGLSVLSGQVDIANARLEWEDGCVANLTASRVSLERMRKIRIFQEDAYLSLDSLHGRGEVVRADREAIAAVLAQAGGSSWNAEAMLPGLVQFVRRQAVPALEGEPLALQLEAFLRACRGEAAEGPTRIATGEEGLAAVRVVAQVRQSLEERTRQWVS
jgi:predicted dehydrogenase